ncbi:hypothetical protein [Arthrobacter sp. ISL-95]|uniref:hypothetical protein n=1 Tax=Arthrobacter sp. ISL-95 TaxID=2819116 RepID=UPI001BEAAFE1|nr:hypothetical protein [Arthrobacter sp. ISL-95]MBT2588339.1 hypothetical protein [Arthrobacter sp. ISL-95]
MRTDPAAYDDTLRRGVEPARMGNERPMGHGWLTVPYERIQDNTALTYRLSAAGIDSRNVSNYADVASASRPGPHLQAEPDRLVR